jgi:gliding motility-associated-like protein
MRFWSVCVIILGSVLWALSTLAQPYPLPCPQPSFNNPGKFRVLNPGKAVDALNVRLCLGDTLRLADESGGSNMSYWFEYKGATIPTSGGLNSSSWIYGSVDTFALIQQGSLNATGSYYCMRVEVLPTPKLEYTINACPGLKASVLFRNPKYDEFVIDWGDGSPPQAFKAAELPVHTYPSARSYQVKLTGRYVPGNCGVTETTTVTALAAAFSLPKLDRLEVLNAASLSLDYKGATGVDVRILQKVGNAGAYQLLTLPPSSGSGTFSQVVSTNLNTRSTVYCYKLAASDACGTQQTNTDAEELCSIPLDVVAGGTQNTLNWPAYQATNFRQYVVARGNATYQTLPLVSTRQYVDPNVQCGEQHCYRLSAQVGQGVSVSEERCVGASTTTQAAAPTNLQGTVVQNRPVLTWAAVAGQPTAVYRVYRSDAPLSGFRAIKDTVATRFNDAAANASQQQYCYQVSFLDVCKIESQRSARMCLIWLVSQGSELGWTPYEGTASTINYSLEELDEAGNVLRSQPVAGTSATPDLSDPTKTLYRFRIRGESGGVTSYSNVTVVSKETRLYVPSAFSPNGDGLNDTFGPIGSVFGSFVMTIYNRWGEVLHRFSDLSQAWDGTYRGVAADEGTYVYRLEVIQSDGKAFVKTGAITLLR